MMRFFLITRIVTAGLITLLCACLMTTLTIIILTGWGDTSTRRLDIITEEIDEKLNKIIDKHKAVIINKTAPLLTLFTTFDLSKNKPYRTYAHREAIKNWSAFRLTIQPVLFHTDDNHPLVKMAAGSGWDLIKLTSFNKYGTPKLKPMFSQIFQKYNSSFYGFANGDILFGESLVNTLRTVERRLKQLNNNVLVVGRRKNVVINLNQSGHMYHISNIEKVGQEARLFRSDAVDYFMFSSENSLNWTALADVVIGRPAYDNYIVGMSLKMGLNVIDATRTLLALHLSTPGVLDEGDRNVDRDYNRKAIGRFRYASGLTARIKLRTILDLFHEIFITKK